MMHNAYKIAYMGIDGHPFAPNLSQITKKVNLLALKRQWEEDRENYLNPEILWTYKNNRMINARSHEFVKGGYPLWLEEFTYTRKQMTTELYNQLIYRERV